MITAYILFFISLWIHGCRSQCPEEKPFYMVDRKCANFSEICVRKDYDKCQSLLQACNQCPASNLTELALVNMLTILRDQRNMNTSHFDARLNNFSLEMKSQISSSFKVIIIIVIVIGSLVLLFFILLVLIEMKFQPFKLRRKITGAFREEATALITNLKSDGTNDQNSANIKNQIQRLTEILSGASRNYKDMTSLIHSFEEKINQKLENFQNQIQMMPKPSSVTVPIKIRGIKNPIKIQINRDDNAVKIKQKICAQVTNTKSYHFKMMMLKLNGTRFDDNEYLADKIRSVKYPLQCDIIENLNPNEIVVVILRGNICLPEMIQFKKSQTIEWLKSVLFQLTGEAADSLKLFRGSNEIDKLNALEDYEPLSVIKMHEGEITIKSIFDKLEVPLSYSNVESVGNIKKKIAKSLVSIADNIILFCDNKHLDDDVFLFQIDIEQLKFCHLIQVENVKITNDVNIGTFSQIFEGQNPWKEEKVMLKKYQWEQNKNLKENKAFLNELITFQITQSHGGFVPLTGVFKERDYFYIMMEKMEGSIKEYIKNNPLLPEEIIVKWAKQILSALQHLHDHFIIHRNIKPSSILLDKDKNIKLSSFGIAKYVHWGDKEYFMEGFLQSRVGTYRYTAPEVFHNDYYGSQVDVWSFGATMIEMATGLEPFHGKNESKALIEIGRTKIIPYELDQSSQKMKDFIDQCLKADPKIRATVDDLLKHDFLRPK